MQSRWIDVTRPGKGRGRQAQRVKLDNANALQLRAAAAVARRERDREARRVSTRSALDTRARSRKIEHAIARATDAVFFELLAQKLEAKRHGLRAVVGGRTDVGHYMVRDLGVKAIQECAQRAAAEIAREAQFVHTGA